MKNIKILVIGLLAFGILFTIYFYLTRPKIVKLQASFATIHDDENAAKLAESIVIGTVNKVVNTDFEGIPKTFISINVEENLKGNIGDTFIFRQDGAYNEKTNELMIFDDYDILQSGKKYVFFLNKVEGSENTYWSMNGPFSVYKIDKDNVINKSDQKRNKKLSALKEVVSKNK